MKYIKLSSLVVVLTIVFVLPSCSLFVVEQPWATGYFFEKPEAPELVKTSYIHEGFTLLLEWEPVSGAIEYKINYTIGSITGSETISNFDSEYGFSLANVLDPTEILDSVISYSIISINNVGESTSSYNGTVQPFGEGTTLNPYRIINSATFMDIDGRADKSFLLLKDLELGTIALTSTFEFDGNLDGMGNEIRYNSDPTGLSDNQNLGLFKIINSGSTITNLNISGEIDTSITSLTTGLLTGECSGIISNCNVSGAINSLYSDQTGGIVGLLKTNGKIINSTSSVDINGLDNVGGIVGCNIEGEIVNCRYIGDVNTLTIFGNSYVGGIAGRTLKSISGCSVIGKFEATSYLGGISGFADNLLSITECSFRGDLSGISYIGGIIGLQYSNVSIFNCISDTVITGETYLGGIAGQCYYIINFSNATSIITSTSTDSSYTGGIAGMSTGTSTITNSNSYGSIVSSGKRVGGLIGLNQASSVNNCKSYSSIVSNYPSNYSQTGGLIGYSLANISFSHAYGTVTAINNDTVGSLIGQEAAGFTHPDCTSDRFNSSSEKEIGNN